MTRKEIIEDILNWSHERELIDGKELNINEARAELERLNNDELQECWRSSVGEWVANRNDVYRTFEQKQEAGEFNGDFDAFIEHQLEKVKAGEPTDYGYLNPIAFHEP